MNEETEDEYGNKLVDGQCDDLQFCTFPDCGCDGARLCMAKHGASERALRQNVEGMWSNGSKPECRKAVFSLMSDLNKERKL